MAILFENPPTWRRRTVCGPSRAGPGSPLGDRLPEVPRRCQPQQPETPQTPEILMRLPGVNDRAHRVFSGLAPGGSLSASAKSFGVVNVPNARASSAVHGTSRRGWPRRSRALNPETKRSAGSRMKNTARIVGCHAQSCVEMSYHVDCAKG